MIRLSIIALFVIGILPYIFAQSEIQIVNNSFEDVPKKGEDALRIGGWSDCGALKFPYESPPDIHPGNFWNNNIPPSDGKTYIGMVVRENDSYEGVSQRLGTPLDGGSCYYFSVDLCRSPSYLSKSPVTKLDAQYTVPTVFRLWASNNICGDAQLLAESKPIDHKEWKTYQFNIKPRENFKYITIEAYYKTPVFIPYSGHILLDNLSNLKPMDCEKKIAAVVTKAEDKIPPHKKGRVEQAKAKNTNPPPKKDTPPIAVVTPKPQEKKILEDLDIKKIKLGSVIEIKNLFFKADSTILESESYAVLDEIAAFLKTHKSLTIEIGGHTNGVPSHVYCDKLSTERAKSVYFYLVDKGVDKTILSYKGYGKRKRIATDLTVEGRNKNQRVELKVLSVG